VVHAHYGGAGALGPPLNGQLLRVIAASGIGGSGREEVAMPVPRSVSSAPTGDAPYLEFPSRTQRDPEPPGDPPLIRVRQAAGPLVHWQVLSIHAACQLGVQTQCHTDNVSVLQALGALQSALQADAVHRRLADPLWLVVPVDCQSANAVERRRHLDNRGEPHAMAYAQWADSHTISFHFPVLDMDPRQAAYQLRPVRLPEQGSVAAGGVASGL
jgi:hypothetical protein